LTVTGTSVFTRNAGNSTIDGFIRVSNFGNQGLGIRAGATSGICDLEYVSTGVGTTALSFLSTGNLVAPFNFQVSSLNVNTISSFGLTTTTINTQAFTTNSTNGIAVAILPANGSAGSTTALSGNIPLLSGGAYRISWNYVASNNAVDGGTFCLLSGLAATPPLLVIPNIELSTGTPVEGYGACIVRNTTGGTVNVTIQGYNTSTTGQTTLAGSTNWLVEYLGQISI
jgi:hypothetical protein